MSYRTLFPLAIAAAIVVSTVNGQGGGTGGNPGGSGGGMVGGSGVRSSSPAFRSNCCGSEGSYFQHKDGTGEWGQKGTNRAPLGCITDPSLSEGGSGMLADGGVGADDACGDCDSSVPETSPHCPDCPGANGGGGGVLPEVDFGLTRRFLPHNQAVYSSFGPGNFLSYDKKFYVYPHPEAGNSIQLFDFISGAVYEMVDGVGTEPFDGVFHDERNKVMKSLTLLDGGGLPTTDLSLAATAKLEDWRGATTEFSIFDLSTDPLEPDYTGRMTKVTDRNGYALTISYRDSLASGSGGFTAQELIDSPDRRYQIYQVVDYQGDTATFEYGTSQVGGRWALSRVVLPDATDVDYEYTDDRLTKVVYANGSEATYVYGQDLIAQTVTVQVYEPRSGKAQKKLHLTNDYITLGTEVINQPQGVLRMVEDDNNEVMLMLIPDDLIPNQFLIYKGDSLAGEVVPAVSTQMYEDGWEFAPQQVGEINGTLEGTYESSVGATTEQLYQGTVPQYADATGRTYSWQYDGDTFPTKKTFDGDSTYEEMSYDTEKNVTRFRDRLGRVTQLEYDSAGNLTKTKTGILEVGGQDVNQAEYAEQVNDYYPSTHVSKGLLKTAFSSLYDGTSADMHRTDYEYDGRGNVTKILESAAATGEDRPEWTYTYDAKDRKVSQTDPMGHTTNFVYDDADRVTRTTYDDGSTAETLYGAPGSGQEHLVLKTKDRRGVVTSYVYDITGRLTQMTVASAKDADILDGQPDDSPITDRNKKSISTYSYLEGTELPISVAADGSTTDTTWDYRHRPIETVTYPHASKSLHVKNTYVDNDLFSTEDPYGRFAYFGYRASDGSLIRYATGCLTTFTVQDEAALFALNRDMANNAPFVMNDALRNSTGDIDLVVDSRGIQHKTEFDSAGRAVAEIGALGTSVESRVETQYDVMGNATEIRASRYFDAADTKGYELCKTVLTYDGRNNLASRAESPGSPEAATEYFSYTLNDQVDEHIDFRGKLWTTTYSTCCGRSLSTESPEGHGHFINKDFAGNTTHLAGVADISLHGDHFDPTDAKTLEETTVRFDELGRKVARTVWLAPLGGIDANGVPIAGLDGVSASDGITSRTFYDPDLTDGVGLDAVGGLLVPKLGGGTYSVSLSEAIQTLGAGVPAGGASIVFDSRSPGRAVITINGEEEIQFTILDNAERAVMAGMIQPHDDPNPNALMKWSCVSHDGVTSHSTYGNLRERIDIDALGHTRRYRTDGAGRTLELVDKNGGVSASEFDGNSNVVRTVDPNGVELVSVFDELDRRTSTVDSTGDTVHWAYDAAGQLVKTTDAKGKFEAYTFDARGRVIQRTDRSGQVASSSYDPNGNLASSTDPDGGQFTCAYDDNGNQVEQVYPDHLPGSNIGDAGYAKCVYGYDAIGRRVSESDQQGDVRNLAFDMAGRLTSRSYSGHVSGPLGGSNDTDVFTYDRAGRLLTGFKGRYQNSVVKEYDGAGRAVSEAITTGGQTYTTAVSYNTMDQIVGYTYPDNASITRTYTPDGRLFEVSRDAALLDTRTYDSGGRWVSSTYGNGVSETRAYNTDNTVSGITFSGAPVGSIAYSWDANTNLTAASISGVMSGFGFSGSGFDDEDRPVSWSRTDGGLDIAWTLTPAGNWSSVTTNSVTQSRTHGPSDELLSAGGQTVVSDAKGCVTLIPALLRSAATDMALAWDFDNHLESADVDGQPGSDVTYEYDVLGRRISRDDGGGRVIYVHIGDLVAAEYDVGSSPSSPVASYVYGRHGAEPIARFGGGGTQYYHRDHQYSVIATTDSSGSVTERYAYDAYGNSLVFDASGAPRANSAIGNELRYAARRYDSATEQYYRRGRSYSPAAGRFFSHDSLACTTGPAVYMNASLSSAMAPAPWSKGQTPKQARDDLTKRLRKTCDRCTTKKCPCTKKECLKAAWEMGRAWYHTFTKNSRPLSLYEEIFGTEKCKGYFCYEWAWSFKAVFEKFGGKCFKMQFSGARVEGSDLIHAWVLIENMCGDRPRPRIYVDDKFGNGKDYIHDKRPCPRGYEYDPGVIDECDPNKHGDIDPPHPYCWCGRALNKKKCLEACYPPKQRTR